MQPTDSKAHEGHPSISGANTRDDHYLKRELYELVQRDPAIFDFLQHGLLDGIWYWDLERPEHEWMSPRFWQVFGYDPSEKKHRASEWQGMVHPDDLKLAIENLRKHCSDAHHPYDQIVRYRHRDGSTIWVRCRGLVFRDDDGRPIRMLGAHVDVSALKHAESRLAELNAALEQRVAEQTAQLRARTEELSRSNAGLERSEERSVFAQEAASIGMFDWDVHSDKATCTALYYRLFGMTEHSEGISAEQWLEGVHPEDRARALDEVRRSLDRGERYDTEYRVVWPDGSIRWVMSKAKVQHDDAGRPVRMVGALVDVTDRKVFEARLQRDSVEMHRQNVALREAHKALHTTVGNLERSNKALDDFAYIASHDLKEPLRGIHNYSVFLLEDYATKLDDEGRAKLETLSRLAQRMETLIDSLLHFSRVGRLDMAVGETDLNVVLEEVLDSLHISLEEQGVDVRIPEPLPTATCDRIRIGEVFRNLITNAMKYNDKNDKWIEIGFHSELPSPESPDDAGERGNLTLYVRDNGIGIPDKHLDSIFRLFKRLHGRDKFGGGTGAGLTLTRKIVERHGGKIWAESLAGKGTTFYFTLEGRNGNQWT